MISIPASQLTGATLMSDLLQAEWMYSQSKGRQFNEGEQEKLVEYLTQTCPLDPSLETEQDRKLNLILSKVQVRETNINCWKPK